jgi:hypothetical protein
VLATGAVSLAVLAVVVALLAMRRVRALEYDRAIIATHLRALSRRITALEESAAARARVAGAVARIGPGQVEADRGPSNPSRSAVERRPRTLH